MTGFLEGFLGSLDNQFKSSQQDFKRKELLDAQSKADQAKFDRQQAAINARAEADRKAAQKQFESQQARLKTSDERNLFLQLNKLAQNPYSGLINQDVFSNKVAELSKLGQLDPDTAAKFNDMVQEQQEFAFNQQKQRQEEEQKLLQEQAKARLKDPNNRFEGPNATVIRPQGGGPNFLDRFLTGDPATGAPSGLQQALTSDRGGFLGQPVEGVLNQAAPQQQQPSLPPFPMAPGQAPQTAISNDALNYSAVPSLEEEESKFDALMQELNKLSDLN